MFVIKIDGKNSVLFVVVVGIGYCVFIVFYESDYFENRVVYVEIENGWIVFRVI